MAAWFCPITVANLQKNRQVSLVIWEYKGDTGYQLLGETEKVEEIAMMNGYVPGAESRHPLPQVERQLGPRWIRSSISNTHRTAMWRSEEGS